jgi:AcrR family transcriptional regulator
VTLAGERPGPPGGPPLAAGSERADRQRERILRAARSCFVRHGFHAAAMADIASAADISPGLIYRYFPSKSALVRAIVDRQLEESRQVFDRIGSAEDLVGALVDTFERWCCPGDGEALSAALIVEIVAVAARDGELAAALRGADGGVRASFETALRRSGAVAGVDYPEAVQRRAALLHWLIDGLLIRAIGQPDMDREFLRSTLATFVAQLGPTPRTAAWGPRPD